MVYLYDGPDIPLLTSGEVGEEVLAVVRREDEVGRRFGRQQLWERVIPCWLCVCVCVCGCALRRLLNYVMLKLSKCGFVIVWQVSQPS